MRIKPMNNRILVKRLPSTKVNQGSIILPPSFKEPFPRYEVIEVGPGMKLKNGRRNIIDVTPGDVVHCGSLTGTQILVDGKEYLFILPSDIVVKELV